MSEIVFDVTQEQDGGYVAEAMGEDIFTQGDTVKDVVSAFYFDGQPPAYIRLHLRKDERLEVA